MGCKYLVIQRIEYELDEIVNTAGISLETNSYEKAIAFTSGVRTLVEQVASNVTTVRFSYDIYELKTENV